MFPKSIFICLVVSMLLIGCKEKSKDTYLDEDYGKVFVSAAQDGKSILIDFYTVWCGGCKGYEKFVFTDSTIRQYLESKFHTARINAELIENKKIVQRYSIHAYPTIIVANSRGEEIGRMIGYKSEYAEKPSLFKNKIESILSGNETVEKLTMQYLENNDSIELLRHIIQDEIIGKGALDDLPEFISKVSKSVKDKNILNELLYWKGYADIWDRNHPDPTFLTELTEDFPNMDSTYIIWSYNDLLNYYLKNNNIDSSYFYFKKCLEFPPERDYYYIRKFARFLYENDRDIELAFELTKEYSELPGAEADHWTPFLQAHRYAYKNQIEKGIDVFDKWVKEYASAANISDNFWDYSFYIDYALFHQVNLDKALLYAHKLEKVQPSPSIKRKLAELLYYSGETDQAVKKLEEIIPLIEGSNEKKEIDKIISDYKSG